MTFSTELRLSLIRGFEKYFFNGALEARMDWAIARQALAGNVLEERDGVWESLRICALSKRRGPITEATSTELKYQALGLALQTTALLIRPCEV